MVRFLLVFLMTFWLTNEVRPIVFEHISALLETAIQYSALLIERAIVGLFRLTSLIIDKVCTERDAAAAIKLTIPFSPLCATSCTSLWTSLGGSHHPSLSQLRSRLCLVLYP